MWLRAFTARNGIGLRAATARNVIGLRADTAKNISGLPVHSLLECGMEQQGPDICDDKHEINVNVGTID